MADTVRLLTRLLAYEAGGPEPSPDAPLSDEDLRALYRLSGSNGLAHLVGHALRRLGRLPEGEWAEAFDRQTAQALWQSENFTYECDRVCDCLSDGGIETLPLKGAVLRAYYPEPWMRTGCDIDILVREPQLKQAVALLREKLSYVPQYKGTHDVVMTAPSGVHLELHFRLMESEEYGKAALPLAAVWEKAVLCEAGNLRRRMPDDLFYYYHIAHMAKHFLNGGCGIRPFLDLWVLGHSSAFCADGTAPLLREGGLAAFAERAETLCSVWFADAPADDVSREMESYLLRGGVYGGIGNAVVAGQVRRGGRLAYVLHRIWMPYDGLVRRYPSLNGRRWLTPFYQCRRWTEAVRFGRTHRGLRELKVNASVGKDERRRTAALLTELGLADVPPDTGTKKTQKTKKAKKQS